MEVLEEKEGALESFKDQAPNNTTARKRGSTNQCSGFQRDVQGSQKNDNVLRTEATPLHCKPLSISIRESYRSLSFNIFITFIFDYFRTSTEVSNRSRYRDLCWHATVAGLELRPCIAGSIDFLALLEDKHNFPGEGNSLLSSREEVLLFLRSCMIQGTAYAIQAIIDVS